MFMLNRLTNASPDENFTLPLRLLKEVGCVGVNEGAKVFVVALMVRLMGERERDCGGNGERMGGEGRGEGGRG